MERPHRGPAPARFVTSVAVCAVALASATVALAQPAAAVSAQRFPQNPLITVATSPSLGGNVNGPTVIRVPDWIDRPLARYYMYFANHLGTFIRLAYADALTGPWRLHEPGVLKVEDTAFFRPQPDPAETLADFYTHVASPEVFVDHARKRLVIWVHGWWTNGERWPADPAAARAWAARNRYSQFTQAAESADGLHFAMRAPITRTSYLRVFEHGGGLYGLSRLGRLSRARDPLEAFELGPNPFAGGQYAGKVRHVGLLKRGTRLHVFFTAIGDAPERVLMSTIDLAGDWTTWRATAPVDVLRPSASYECADLPIAPSEAGDIDTRVNQIRDPFVFDEQGRAFLFYATCGEQGIAAAELTFAGEGAGAPRRQEETPVASDAITQPTETEIVVTRTFPAPRERVFAALTEAAHIRRWMRGPDITLESVDTDVRPGGASRQVFVRPSGRRLEVFGAYQEVEAPSRFVYAETYGFSPLRIVVTTTLVPVTGGTRFTQSIRYASKAERDADYPGVAESAGVAYAELARYLAQQPLNWAADDGARVAALEKDGTRLQGEHVIVWFPRSLPGTEASALVTRLDAGVAGLWRRVGTHDWQAVPKGPITYYLSDDTFVSHASGRGAVFVPMARVRDGRAPFLHEAMHELLASTRIDAAPTTPPVRRPLWLTEGLPDYVARLVAAEVGQVEDGPWNTPSIAGVDAICTERARTADGATMLPFVGSDRRPDVLFTTDRGRFAPTFYTCSFSFVKHLVEGVGLPAMIDLFAIAPSAANARLEQLGGKPLTEWRADWRRRLALD